MDWLPGRDWHAVPPLMPPLLLYRSFPGDDCRQIGSISNLWE